MQYDHTLHRKKYGWKILIFHDQKVFSKIWKIFFWEILKISENFWKIQKFYKDFIRKPLYNFWIFKKMFKNFRNFRNFPKKYFSKFWKYFFVMKNQYFSSRFFSVQGMIILHRIVTPALSLFHCARNGTGRGPRTLQNHPDPPSCNVFSRRPSFVDNNSFRYHHGT